MKELFSVKILGLSYSQTQKDCSVLTLVEEKEGTRIPIIIGNAEAHSIAMELENIKTPRPLTHDLFKQVADILNFQVVNVIINKYEDGIFYSQLEIFHNGKTFEIDSRTSDAIALAIRFKCPIHTTKDVLEWAGITQEEFEISAIEESMSEEELEAEEKRMEYVFDSKEELEKKLLQAIQDENYEQASIIRDELKSRGNTNSIEPLF